MLGQYKRKKQPSKPQVEVHFLHNDFTESGRAKLREAITEATGYKVYSDSVVDLKSKIGDVAINEDGKSKVWEWEER